MTMHMVHPGLTTINTGKSKKKLTAKQIKSQQEHEKWLRDNNVHPDQLASRNQSSTKRLTSVVKAETDGPQCNNGFAFGGSKKSIFDSQWQKKYVDDPVMAERERVALAQAESKKGRVFPLYNKGGYQYGGDIKMTDIGKRRP